MVFFIPGFRGIDIFEFTLFMVEWQPILLAVNVVFVFLVHQKLRKWVICFFPILWLALILGAASQSFEDASERGYDVSLPSIRQAVEAYIETGEGDINDILESDKYAPTFGKDEMHYLMTDLFTHTLFHLDLHNEQNIPIGYNKGNDWFKATLGEAMVYTSGIYRNGDESLLEAQKYKLDYVADAIQLKKGENVLDIGCGWGRLVQHFADEYGAKATGITLSSEQRKFGLELNKHNDVKIHLQDAMKMQERTDLPEGGYDKITSLEMAEHVGIRRYGAFLRGVRDLLKDDGVFYIQVAGLRRHWRFEDFVWGLFMGEHVFPGADASCPLGWVVTQLERAGFEVQRTHNLGSHYSKTLGQWLEEWRASKTTISKKYGDAAWRRWEVFLAWSTRIAREGSSTVFMITATKAGVTSARLASQKNIAPQL